MVKIQNKKINSKRLTFIILSLVILITFIIGIINYHYTNVKAEEKAEAIKNQEIENAYYPENYIGYRFKVLPGTSSWPYGDFSEMIDVCRIPNEELEMMSTEELIQTVLVHPLIYNVYAYDDTSVGFEIVKSYCDCLQELCNRNDRVDSLYDYLSKHKESFICKQDSTGDKYIDFLIMKPKSVFFLLASNENFYNDKIGSTDKVLEKINQILQEGGETTPQNRDYSLESFYAYFQAVNGVFERTVHNVHNYSMNGMQCESGEYWLGSDGLVHLETFSEVTPDASQALTEAAHGLYGIYPDSGYGPTIEYNCHSYAWNNDYKYTCWVNEFNSGGFTETTYTDVSVGGNVVYYNSYGNSIGSGTSYKHSAVVTGKMYHTGYTLVVKSKWGPAGLYTHTLGNCPYYYYDKTTYTPCDRKYFDP